MDFRARRVAQNEALGRQINERIEAQERPAPGESLVLLCECADADCSAKVEVTREDYERIRANPGRFVTVNGHELTAIEVVVEDRGEWLVVEKGGEARDVAEETDPRGSENDEEESADG